MMAVTGGGSGTQHSPWESFVGTPEDIAHRMLKLAQVRPNESVYDLGCGDGRIPIIAAKHFRGYGVGVEIRKSLVRKARDKAAEAGVSGRVTIIHGSFRRADLRQADVLALYLTSSTLADLRTKFEEELQPGTRITTHDYPIFGWTPYRMVNFKSRERAWTSTIYLYVR